MLKMTNSSPKCSFTQKKKPLSSLVSNNLIPWASRAFYRFLNSKVHQPRSQGLSSYRPLEALLGAGRWGPENVKFVVYFGIFTILWTYFSIHSIYLTLFYTLFYRYPSQDLAREASAHRSQNTKYFWTISLIDTSGKMANVPHSRVFALGRGKLSRSACHIGFENNIQNEKNGESPNPVIYFKSCRPTKAGNVQVRKKLKVPLSIPASLNYSADFFHARGLLAWNFSVVWLDDCCVD